MEIRIAERGAETDGYKGSGGELYGFRSLAGGYGYDDDGVRDVKTREERDRLGGWK